jgi:non-canonical (house-cleaning) NTP pyrophosphatase
MHGWPAHCQTHLAFVIHPAYPFRWMDKIIVAVGSTRGPKLNAVRQALLEIGPKLDSSARFEVVGREVPSGVSHTPASRGELMAGARGRAEALGRMAHEQREPWRYFVGLEGGLDMLAETGRRQVFLQSWAYVADATGRGAFGQSGGVLLPEALAKEVLDRGVELSVAIDAFAGGHGIRDAEGAWGVLTGNLITRQEAFRFALINAFAPFVNPALYSR